MAGTNGNTVYLGADPGLGGGLAFLFGDGPVPLIWPMPATDRDLWDEVDRHLGPGVAAYAVLEKVGGFVQGNPAPGSAMFRFGASYGALRMALTASGYSWDEVTPQKWQKAMGVAPRQKGEAKGAHKNRLKALAQRLFPGIKVTLATCDALLLAEYCRRSHQGRL